MYELRIADEKSLFSLQTSFRSKSNEKRENMKPQIFALLTAIAWGVGGYFEKKGLHLGKLSPQMGITIRTFVALIVLSIASYPHWKTIVHAGSKALTYMIIG